MLRQVPKDCKAWRPEREWNEGMFFRLAKVLNLLALLVQEYKSDAENAAAVQAAEFD